MSTDQASASGVNWSMVIGLTLIFGWIVYSIAEYVAYRVNMPMAAAAPEPNTLENRIKPIGQVRLVGQAQPVIASAPAMSAAAPAAEVAAAPAAEKPLGERIYSSACFACHGTGAAGAPKLGDQAAWTPRSAQGMAVLMQHATNGFNAMPARGGNAALTDDELKAAITYMLERAQLSAQ